MVVYHCDSRITYVLKNRTRLKSKSAYLSCFPAQSCALPVYFRNKSSDSGTDLLSELTFSRNVIEQIHNLHQLKSKIYLILLATYT